MNNKATTGLDELFEETLAETARGMRENPQFEGFGRATGLVAFLCVREGVRFMETSLGRDMMLFAFGMAYAGQKRKEMEEGN